MIERSTDAIALFKQLYGELPADGRAGSLVELVRRFGQLPYENLSKILAWEGGQRAPHLRLPRQVMQEHMELGTGGTCFSLTELLRQLARAVGFECYPVMAHMKHGQNIHCALRVEARGRAYLVDPGYLVRRPLPLDLAQRRSMSLEPCSEEPRSEEPLLVPAGRGPVAVPHGVGEGDFDLFTIEPDGPRWRYRFSDVAPGEEAFLEHWRQSFFLPGMRSLVASCRADGGERLYLHNHKLRAQGPTGKTTAMSARPWSAR
jgi:hypothetical protein